MTAVYEGSILYSSQLLKGSCGYAIDIGGSLIKAAFIDKEQDESSDLTKVRLASFKPSDISAAMSYILEHGVEPGQGTSRVITTTGVGVRGEIVQEIEEKLKLKVDNIVETPPMYTAFFDLVKTRPLPEAVLPVPDHIRQSSQDLVRLMVGVEKMLTKAADDWTDDYARMTALHAGIPSAPPPPPVRNKPTEGEASGRGGKDGSTTPLIVSHPHLFPCIISSLGTGCNMSKLYINGRAAIVGGNGRAGKTLMGLASLLLGISDYDELLELASKGTDSTLSIYSKDLKPPRQPGEKADDYDVWPDALRIFSFGKAVGKNLGDQKREDVARALVSHVCDDLAMTYHMACRAEGCRSLFVCGGLLEHQLVRDTLWSSFNGQNVGHQVELYFLKEGWFYPAIGCLRYNAYRAQSQQHGQQI